MEEKHVNELLRKFLCKKEIADNDTTLIALLLKQGDLMKAIRAVRDKEHCSMADALEVVRMIKSDL